MDAPLTVDLEKLKKRVKWKFRGFLAALVLCILAVAAGGYAIHPGLAIMVIGSSLGYFAHVNAKMLDDVLRQVRQAEQLMAAMPKEKDLLKDFVPGGYH